MLDVVSEDGDPVVLAFLPHGEFWRREFRVGEGAKRDSDQAVELTLNAVVNRRSAVRAEVVGDLVPAVGKMNPNPGLTLDRDLVRGPAGLGREGTAGPFLAIEAMTHRDANRLTGCCRP